MKNENKVTIKQKKIMIHKFSRYLLTLVALLAMTTGAWADNTVTWEGATLKSVNVASYGDNNKTQTIGDITVTANSGYFKDFGSGSNGVIASAYQNNGLVFSANAKFKSVEVTASSSSTFNHTSGSATSYTYTVDPTATSFALPYGDGWIDITKIVFTFEDAPAPGIEVTTNAASEGATFTEASFQMPAFDATAEYELVRDMGYKVAFSGVPTRARLAKDGNGKFHFADGLTFQLLDNIDAANPKDITSAEGITFMVGEVVPFDFEGSTFYQLDKETLVPLADFLADAHLGTYAICAVASTGEYDGSFSSGMITLFQGYEVEVAAKEFITYYKDEPLYADTETSADAELYTITSVSADQATLSAAIQTAPSLTPLLIFNNSDEAKTFLLIPANEEPNLQLTVAPEFQGTLTARDFTADDMAAADYYTLSGGKIFVPVYEAGTIAANKCWLQFNHQQTPGARTITLVFGDDATGINSMVNGQWPMDTWYDLNGRKLDKMPTKKGIYIKNGKKVVVR